MLEQEEKEHTLNCVSKIKMSAAVAKEPALVVLSCL